MRQASGAGHETKNKRDKIDARVLEKLLLLGCAIRLPLKRLAMQRHATQGLGALIVVLHGLLPNLLGFAGAFGQCLQVTTRLSDH